MIKIICPNCHAEYDVEDSVMGAKVECSECNTSFIADACCSQKPSCSGVELDEEQPHCDIQAAESSHEEIAVKCPYCGTGYELDSQFEGASCRCNVCNRNFVATRVQSAGTAEERPVTSADSLKAFGPIRSTRTKVRPKMLMALCALLVAGILGAVVFIVVTKSGVKTKTGGADFANSSVAEKTSSADEQFDLGMRYFKGEGVAQDDREAAKWFHKAAEQGHTEAQCLLGSMYGVGRGVAEDMHEAVRWLREAAVQGCVEAQCLLAACYYEGNGVDRDEKEAVRWFRKAAEAGNAEAQFHLAKCYAKGVGVGRDVYESVKWLRKAAEQGKEEAIKALRVLEDHVRTTKGEGVVPDSVKTRRSFRTAAGQGNAEELYNLGMQARDALEGERLLKMAAERGHAEAQYQLGLRCSFEGSFYKGNKNYAAAEECYRQAKKWLRMAAEQGHEDAIVSLRSLGAEY